ncbi:MAG: hypothetical protein QXG67_03380 [Candidatus Nitrosotenuis sp.]
MVDKMRYVVTLVLVFLVSVTLAEPVFSETPVKIELAYPNGDRVYLNSAVKIVITSSDGKTKQEVVGEPTKPYLEAYLLTNHRYQVQTYVEEMLLDTTYVELDRNMPNLIKITIPSSSGLKFTILYNDGRTPINGATVSILGNSGKTLREGSTDFRGETIRYWLPPTPAKDNHYKIIVSLDSNTKYTYQTPINARPGNEHITIKTDWPSLVDYVRVHVYEDEITKLRWGNTFSAKLYDKNNLGRSVLFNNGEAYFTTLAAGSYRLEIVSGKSEVWYNQTILVVKKFEDLRVIVSQPQTPSTVQSETPKTITVQAHNNSYTDSKILSVSDSISDRMWKLESPRGTQIYDSVQDKTRLSLTTDGDGLPVFTRSPQISPQLDLADKQIQFRIKVDRPENLKEIWLSFSSDGFRGNWFTYRPQISEIVQDRWHTVVVDVFDITTTGTPDFSKIDRIQVRVSDKGTPVTLTIEDAKIIPKGQQEAVIPAWIKHNARWWADGLITDSDFIQSVQFLLKNHILKIPAN